MLLSLFINHFLSLIVLHSANNTSSCIDRYFFPRQLLIPHFWTPSQQLEFRRVYHSLRARHHWPVLKGLEYTSQQVKNGHLQRQLKDLCAKVSIGNV